MSQMTLLPSTLSRLGRESEMLETIITMMGDERFALDTAHGTPRRDVIARLATRGTDLTTAVAVALGEEPPVAAPDADPRVTFRESHQAFVAVAARLDDLDTDTAISYDGMTLFPGDVVPQRIAEVVLANAAVSSLWSLDEADPDSVRDALDALVRRLEFLDDIPPLTLTTREGDEWSVHGGGEKIHGTREFLAGWLAYGDNETERDLPEVPRWG